MSKSIGNTVTLEHYLENFGADVTRMALVSCSSSQEDFYFSEKRLEFFQDFSRRLWHLGQAVALANDYNLEPLNNLQFSQEDRKLISEVDHIAKKTDSFIVKYMLASAQEEVCSFLSILEDYTKSAPNKKIQSIMMALKEAYKRYLSILHPFMPFMTEKLYDNLYDKSSLLADAHYPVQNSLTKK